MSWISFLVSCETTGFLLVQRLRDSALSRLGSLGALMSRRRRRPPDASGEWAFTEILGPGVSDHLVGAVR